MSYTQYSQYSKNQYDSGPGAEVGNAAPHHLVHPTQDHVLSNFSAISQTPSQSHVVISRQDFLARVDFAKAEIRTLTSNIQEIAALHQRSLSSPDSNVSAQLESLVTETQLKNTQIKDQIKFLEADSVKTEDGAKSLKARQAKQLKNEFEKSLNEYRKEELAYRQRYRGQIARQFRIINPEASDAEVAEASELDWGSEGVFQTALKSNRHGQASSVLGAVRARHNELQRIESTLADLADMFADLAQVVETQDPVIEDTEQNAIQTNEHVDKANNQIETAKKSAQRVRKLKWYCLLVVLLIVIAIALGVGIGVGLVRAGQKSTQQPTGTA